MPAFWLVEQQANFLSIVTRPLSHSQSTDHTTQTRTESHTDLRAYSISPSPQ